jgi:hypothetical protein
MSDLELKVDVQKIEEEIKRLRKEHKFYWYDFNVKARDAKIISDYFGEFYEVELRPCPQGRFCDVIINLTKLIK